MTFLDFLWYERHHLTSFTPAIITLFGTAVPDISWNDDMRSSLSLSLLLGMLLILASSMLLYERISPAIPEKPLNVTVSVPTSKTPITVYKSGTAGDYLNAHHANVMGDHQKAALYLDRVFKQTPPKDGMLMLSMRHHLLSGNVEKAIMLSHKADFLKQSVGAVELLQLVEALHKGDNATAASAAEKLTPDGLQSLILPFTQSWFLFAEKGAAIRVDVADNLKQGMYNALQSYHEALKYQLLKDEKSTGAAYESAISSLRFTPDATIFSAARFFETNDKHDRAMSLFNAVKQSRGRETLWNLREAEGYLSELRIYDGSDVKSLKDGIAEIFTNIGFLLLHENINEESQSFFQLSLYLRPNDQLTRLNLGQAQEKSRQYDAAIDTYSHVIEPPFLQEIATLYKARTYHSMGKSDKARELLHHLEATGHGTYNIAIMLGDLERIDKHYELSAAQYSKALRSVGTLKAYDWPLLFQRGVMYDLSGQWDKALEDFNATLKLQPNEPQVLNYLGYSWLMRGENLKAAEAMLKRALDAAPDEPNIMDSYGYALYLRGDYKGAYQMIEKALGLLPQDPTINEHYGDVLWKIGRRTEAQYYWRRALEFKPTEPGVEMRLNEKLEKGI